MENSGAENADNLAGNFELACLLFSLFFLEITFVAVCYIWKLQAGHIKAENFIFMLTSSLKWLKSAKFGCCTLFWGVFSETPMKWGTWREKMTDTERPKLRFIINLWDIWTVGVQKYRTGFVYVIYEDISMDFCLQTRLTCDVDGLGGRAGGGGNHPLFTPKIQTTYHKAINYRNYVSVLLSGVTVFSLSQRNKTIYIFIFRFWLVLL